MSDWFFTANAVPKAQPRARATAFGGKARMWTPATADGFKLAVGVAARTAMPADILPLRGGVALAIAFYFPRPQRLARRSGGAREMIPYISRPDIDNLSKAVMDALVDCGALHDDAPIFHLAAGKYYAEPDGLPRAEIYLTANTDTP